MNPSVSVIIPAYNASKTLLRAVESVLQQGLPDLEIIVVDDHSSDNTKESISQYLTSTARIQYFFIAENSGPGGARNAGLAAAQGEFLAFLDADDQWKTGKLSKQVEFLQANPEIDVVFTDCTNVNVDNHTTNKLSAENGEFLRSLELAPIPEFPNFFLLKGQVREELFRKFFILISSAVIRRTAITRIQGFNPERRGTEDVDMFVRLSVQSNFAYWNQEKVIRYQTTDSISSMSERWLNELLAYYEMCLKSEDYQDLQHLTKRNLQATYIGFMGYNGFKNQPAKVWSAYRDNLKFGFSFKALLYVIISLLGSFPLSILQAHYRKKIKRKAGRNNLI